MGSNDESDKKRRASSGGNLSPPHKKQALNYTDEKKVDASVLQFQNQKLSQKLEVQRDEIQELQTRLSGFEKKQAEYDETLMVVNRVWDQLVDDLELFAVRMTTGLNGSQAGAMFHPKKSFKYMEGNFLHQLLRSDFKIDSNHDDGNSQSHVEEALNSRSAQTSKLLKSIVQAMEYQRGKNEELANALKNSVSDPEVSKLIRQTEEDLRTEVKSLRQAIDALHLKQREISSEAASLRDTRTQDQESIKRLSDQLEDAQTQLETARRKLASLKSRENGVARPAQLNAPPPSPREALPAGPPAKLGKVEEDEAQQMPKEEATCRSEEAEKLEKDLRELRGELEEAQSLAASRLAELDSIQEEKVTLQQQMRELQSSYGDEQHVRASRPYIFLTEQLYFVRAEADRYRLIADQLQRERDHLLLREKEVLLQAEAAEMARRSGALAEARSLDLEARLGQVAREREELAKRVEEMTAAAGRKETVAELKTMVSTLRKEVAVAKGHLQRRDSAVETAHRLKAENHTLGVALERKTKDYLELSQRTFTWRERERKLEEELKARREGEKELQVFVEMLEKETNEPRELTSMRRSEARALSRVSLLQAALDDHPLALRVAAANEAEAACQQRLAAAEAEVAELRDRSDRHERETQELREALQSKEEEAEAFLSEIESIGQAYEDMQSQNRRLLQQITERDDYNMQLMAESVKAKQLQTSLQADKGAMEERMRHAAATADIHKQRTARLEEQAKTSLEQLAKASEDLRVTNQAAEAARRQQVEAEREAAAARAAKEAAEKEWEDRGKRLEDVEGELEKERFKRKRVEEEKGALSRKLSRISGSGETGGSQGAAEKGGSAAVEQLQQQIQEYKSILKCSVCRDRPKEVVITKCFHLFCSPCIQRNLEIRHRKCPGCGVPFGQNDVRNVYI